MNTKSGRDTWRHFWNANAGHKATLAAEYYCDVVCDMLEPFAVTAAKSPEEIPGKLVNCAGLALTVYGCVGARGGLVGKPAAAGTWNEFQTMTKGQFRGTGHASARGRAWAEYKQAHGIETSSQSPYQRISPSSKAFREQVSAGQPRNSQGEMVDPHTGRVLGTYRDLGHRPEYQHALMQRVAEREGWTQQQWRDFNYGPTHYWWEDPSINRSGKYDAYRPGR